MAKQYTFDSWIYSWDKLGTVDKESIYHICINGCIATPIT